MSRILSNWTLQQMEDLYSQLGSFRKCAKHVGTTHGTWIRYYNDLKKNNVLTPTIKNVPKILERTKFVTKSASSNIFLDPDQMRVALLDIEATGLRGDFGMILCCVIKPIGGRDTRQIFKLDFDNPDLLNAEKNMLLEIKTCLEGFQGSCGYFSSRYDIPMLRTRMIYHGIKPIPKQKHLDVYFTVKRIINTSSRRMERVGDLMRVNARKDLPQKTKMDINEWIKVAFSRDKTSLGYIVDHCIADVDMLEGILEELRDFVPDRIMRT
jgi:uncharacterized protein YprB with RNaseH-like and TPR domain